MSAYDEARRRVTEKITLLWTIAYALEAPVAKPPVARKGHWILPMQYECQLADDFAFMAGFEDGEDDIKAVCIEEMQDIKTLVIRVASNAGSLGSVISDLQKTANAMLHAGALGLPRSQVTSLIFDRIVALDRERILTSLGSRHDSRTPSTNRKPSLLASLVNIVNGQTLSGEGSEEACTVREYCQYALDAFKKFEQAEDSLRLDSQDLLQDLLVIIHQFDMEGLKGFLNTIQPPLDLRLKIYFSKELSRLSRYVQIARNFTGAVKNPVFANFEQVQVCGVTCNKIDTDNVVESLGTFDSVLEKVAAGRHKNLPLLIDAHNKNARPRYNLRVKHWARPCEVHAEIQLLLFYEMNTAFQRPRTISSSKSACYLCALFCQLHGNFHIPHTHDILNDKWILPDFGPEHSHVEPRMIPLLEELEKVLDSNILQVLGQKPSKIGETLKKEATPNPPGSSDFQPPPATSSTTASAHEQNESTSEERTKQPAAGSDSQNKSTSIGGTTQRAAGSDSQNQSTSMERIKQHAAASDSQVPFSPLTAIPPSASGCNPESKTAKVGSHEGASGNGGSAESSQFAASNGNVIFTEHSSFYARSKGIDLHFETDADGIRAAENGKQGPQDYKITLRKLNPKSCEKLRSQKVVFVDVGDLKSGIVTAFSVGNDDQCKRVVVSNDDESVLVTFEERDE